MPISYQKRRQSWLEMAQAFPAPLDKKVSLRNIPKVARLSPAQQQALAQAVQAGLKRIPTALDYLEVNPDATPQELLDVVTGPASHPEELETSQGIQAENNLESPSTMTHTDIPSPHTLKALEELVGLLNACYPEMNPHSAKALAESQALRDVLAVLVVYQQVFDSPHFNTDFVVVLFHKLLERTWEQLNRRIAANPAYQQALQLSTGRAGAESQGTIVP